MANRSLGRRMTGAVGAAGALTLLFAGCRVDNPAFEPPAAVCGAGEYFVGQEFTLADPSKLDVLFVVDNSSGMGVNQQGLASAMPTLVGRLNAIEGLDWRLGVTSTDLADQGHTLTGGVGSDECGGTRPTFVDRSTADGGRVAGCNVLLGEAGSEFEQGLEAARRAIEGGADFMRDDARLLIVFFSSEDDCTAQASLDRSDPNNCVWQPSSLFSVSDFAHFFASSARRGVAGNPVSVVSIVGPPDNRSYVAGDLPDPSCEGRAPALSGTRYVTLADSYPLDRYGFFESICATSFVPTMVRIAEQAATVTDDELCVLLPMAREPEAVVLKKDGNAVRDLSIFGEYLALGATDACANGALSISSDAHGADGNTVEVRFCTTQDPSSL
ncbi:MAG: hypothetical protein H6700_10575 [Myxococcales bacterium]|nr:hypothetical protein [Myxococcales bacterium]